MEPQTESLPLITASLREWEAPIVSELPLPELTQAGFTGTGADGGFYS